MSFHNCVFRVLTLLSNSFATDSDRIAEYEMKLMDIDADQLGIPETEYDARVTMPASEFARIVKDLSQLGESVRIEVSKEGVRFASEGEAANGNVLLKHSEGAITGGRIVAKKEDDEDEDNEAEKPSKSKTKVKKEKDDDDMEMDAEEEKEDFKPDEDGEEEQDEEEDEDEEGSSKKRKKKVSVNSCHLAHPVAYCRFLRPALRSQARKRRHQKRRMKMTILQGSSSR